MVNLRLLLSACAWLGLSTMIASCNKPCTTSTVESCQASGMGTVTVPARFGDTTCPIRVDASQMPNLVFNQSCNALNYWYVQVTLPQNRGAANYVLPSSEVVVNGTLIFNTTETYSTVTLRGTATPSLRLTGGTINVADMGGSGGAVSVNVQFESSIAETLSLVEQVTYNDCMSQTETSCSD